MSKATRDKGSFFSAIEEMDREESKKKSHSQSGSGNGTTQTSPSSSSSGSSPKKDKGSFFNALDSFDNTPLQDTPPVNVKAPAQETAPDTRTKERARYDELWGKANVTTGVTDAEQKELDELSKIYEPKQNNYSFDPLQGINGNQADTPLPNNFKTPAKTVDKKPYAWDPYKSLGTTPEEKNKAGLVEKGNIDLYKQPDVYNPETGGRSTVWSMSIGTDKGETLISRVTPDGKILSEKEAVDYYNKTGNNLGTFKDVESADKFAQQLHNDYEAGKYKIDYRFDPNKILKENPKPVVNVSGREVKLETSFPNHPAAATVEAKELQERINSGTTTANDVALVAKSMGRSIPSTSAYLKGDVNTGEVIHYNDVKTKEKDLFTGLVNKSNEVFGLNDNYNQVFATAETASNYLQKLQNLYNQKNHTEDVEATKEFEKHTPVISGGTGGIGGADLYGMTKVNKENSDANLAALAEAKNLLVKEINQKVFLDPTLSKEQAIQKAYQLSDPTGEKNTSAALDDIKNAGMLSKLRWSIFKDDKHLGKEGDIEMLNAPRASIELQYNRTIKDKIDYNESLKGAYIEDYNRKVDSGEINADDPTSFDKYNNAINAIDTENKKLEKNYVPEKQILAENPSLVKQQLAYAVNEYNAIRSTNVEGQDRAGYQDDNLGRHLQALGFDLKSQVVRDFMSEYGNNVKDYSLLGGLPKNIIGTFGSAAKSIGDLTGMRDEADREAEKIHDQMFPTAVGETDEYKLKNSAKHWQNIANTTGQVLGQGLLQAGTLGLGRMAGLTKMAALETAFWGSGSLTSFDQALKDSSDFIDNKAGRLAYAGLIALSNAASERIFPDYKIFEIPGVQNVFAELSNKVGSAGFTKELAEELLGKAKNKVLDFMKKAGTEFTSQTAKETGEELITQVFEDGLRYIAGDPNANYEKAVENAKNTAYQTATGMAFVAGMGAVKKAALEKNIAAKSVIYNAAIYHDEAIDAINKGFQENKYSEFEKNAKIKTVNTARNAAKSMLVAEQVAGREMTRPQRELYVANLTAESLLKEQQKEANDPVVEKKIEERITNLQNQRDELLEDKITIDEFGDTNVSKIQPTVSKAIIQIGDKTYEGNNHAEAIAAAKTAGEDISIIDRKRDGKFKLSDGTIIDRATAKKDYGAENSEQLIKQNDAAKEANKEYYKEHPPKKEEPAPAEETLSEKETAAVEAIKGKEFTGSVKGWTDVIQDENSSPSDKKQALKELHEQLTDPNSEVQMGTALGGKASDAIYDLAEPKKTETAPVDEKIKPYQNAIDNIDLQDKTDFVDNGEMSLTGKKFNPGLKLTINNSNDFRNNLEDEGVEVITKTLTPAVMKDGKLSKSATVDVGIFDSIEDANKYLSEQKVKRQKSKEKHQAKIEEIKAGTTPAATTIAPNPALESVESTAKALEAVDVETNLPASHNYDLKDTKSISKAYHQAKGDGTNPKLVKAVEGLLGGKTVTVAAPEVKAEPKAAPVMPKRRKPAEPAPTEAPVMPTRTKAEEQTPVTESKELLGDDSLQPVNGLPEDYGMVGISKTPNGDYYSHYEVTTTGQKTSGNLGGPYDTYAEARADGERLMRSKYLKQNPQTQLPGKTSTPTTNKEVEGIQNESLKDVESTTKALEDVMDTIHEKISEKVPDSIIEYEFIKSNEDHKPTKKEIDELKDKVVKGVSAFDSLSGGVHNVSSEFVYNAAKKYLDLLNNKNQLKDYLENGKKERELYYNENIEKAKRNLSRSLNSFTNIFNGLNPNQISESYHADKAAGKETELTKAIEKLLTNESTPTEANKPIQQNNTEPKGQIPEKNVPESSESVGEGEPKTAVSILKENDVTLQKADNDAELTKLLPDTLSPTEKQGSIAGGEENATATAIVGAISKANDAAKERGKGLSPDQLKKEEVSRLKEYAKENDLILPDNFGEAHANGMEQDVYLNPDGKTVTKIHSNITHDTWNELFHRIAIHNALFPDVAYTLKGFTTHEGHFSAIFEQPLVTKSGEPIKFSEVTEEMNKLGFELKDNITDPNTDINSIDSKVEGTTSFVNNKTGVEISDLHGENVMRGTDGILHFIDPIIELTPDRKNNPSKYETESTISERVLPAEEQGRNRSSEIDAPETNINEAVRGSNKEALGDTKSNEPQKIDVIKKEREGKEKAEVVRPSFKRKPIRDELRGQINALAKDFFKDDGTLTSGGLSSEKIEKGTTLIGLYMKAGIYKFADIVEDLYAEYGDKIRTYFDALKYVYGGYYNSQATEEEGAKMDSSLLGLTFDRIIPDDLELQDELIPSVLPEQNEIIEANDPVRSFIDEVKERIKTTERQDIRTLRKLASDLNIDVKDTTLQEMVEMAMVELSRDVAKSTSMDDAQKLAIITGLYENQPTISMRSADRIENQQYSTPAPLAFISGVYVNAANPQSILEPSAGNGMMVINFPPSLVTANEIDPVRLENLGKQDFALVTNQDALQPFPFGQKDGVIMNPPFGSAPQVTIDGYKISGLDERMILNALSHLAPNGRAAIIMGGHNEYDDNGRLTKERTFFNYLYNHYKVDDVINVDGQLYQKQGTTFPIRLILIDGVKENPEGFAPLGKKDDNKVAKSFKEVLAIINQHKTRNNESQNLLQSPVDANGGQGNNLHGESATGLQGKQQGELSGIPAGTVRTTKPGSKESKRTPGTTGGRNTGSANTSGQSNTQGLSEGNNGERPVQNVGGTVSARNEPDTGDNGTGSNGELQGEHTVQSARKFSTNELSENEKVEYRPKSTGTPVGTVIPSQMASEAERILTDLDNQFGGIDNYVKGKLNYDSIKDLHEALSAEQIDAVAMAINQIERGEGMIIGDMTGVGKGRIAAAIVRYAVAAGKKPIFLTEKPNLFSDLYRDMVAIGSDKLVPFIVNDKSSDNDPTITDEKGNVVHKVLNKAGKKTIFENKQLPDAYDFIMSTYSQFRSSPSKPSIKKDFFLNVSQGNILILDEAHNVSGDSNSGALFQEVLTNSQGVTYLSATFAKRPDNMPVYAVKTAMKEANMTKEELINAIEVGGVALQEVVSAQLVESGQMLRRERSFAGVDINYEVLHELGEAHRQIADSITDVIRDVINFQTVYVNPVIKGLDKEASAEQGMASGKKGTSMAGVDNTPFASKVFNVIDQMLFAIKALDVADATIEELKKGRKPVIGFKSTMESFLKNMDIQPGEKLEKIDFTLTLKRALEGTMRYTVTDHKGEKTHHNLSLSDLSPEAQKMFALIADKIRKASTGITISPIDTMIKKIQDAGYTVKEITGRSMMLELNDDGGALVTTRTDKDVKKIAREFNNGDLDVIMINASGATGISLHASQTFKDQRQRVMIDGQLELDINKAIQKRGRIDRTGQVLRGAYRYIVSAIPAESRLLMMFKSKLKSLDANTTSSQKSKESEVDVTDFLNKYGDEVVTELLKEDKQLNRKLLDPLKFDGKSEDELADIKTVEGAARKVTGRVAILPTKDQSKFYKEVAARYDDYISYLESNNENDLEVKVLPLNAKTLNKQSIIIGKGGESPFGQDSTLETVEVDVLKKPLKKAEVDADVKVALDGKTPEKMSEQLATDIDKFYEGYIKQEVKDIDEDYDRKRSEVTERVTKKTQKEGGDVQSAVQQALAELEEAKQHRQESAVAKYTGVKNNLVQWANYFKTGSLYYVPISVRTDTIVGSSKGVFLGFKISDTRKNPYAPSAMIMKFAVNDGRRMISVPLSKADFVNAIGSNTSFYSSKERKDALDSWDTSQSTRTRDKRYLVTGNLLQAYGTNKGQLISYTDDKGDMRKGMLLPEDYKIGDQKVRIPAGQAAPYLQNRFDKIRTVDNEVDITNTGYGDYSIEVPLSKQSGGKYFLDKGLQALVNNRGFNQRAGRMSANFQKEQLQEVLDYMQNVFNSSVEITGAAKESGTSTKPPLFSSRSETKEFESNDKTPVTVKLLERKYPDAIVVKSQSDLPEAVQKEAKANGINVEGVLFNGQVYMVADNIETMGRAEGVYRHEKIGHEGVISVLKSRLNGFVSDLIDKSEGIQKRAIDKLSQRLFGKNSDQLTDAEKNTLGQEYIAEAAENPGKYPTTWQKIVTFVKQTLRDLGIKLSVTDKDIKVLLSRAKKNVEMPTRGVVKTDNTTALFSSKKTTIPDDLKQYADDFIGYMKQVDPNTDADKVIEKLETQRVAGEFTDAESVPLYEYVKEQFGVKEPPKPKEAKEPTEKSKIDDMVNSIGENSQDAELMGITHRQDVDLPVLSDDTVKSDKIVLSLIQQDAINVLNAFKDEYGKKYLSKALNWIKNANITKISQSKIQAFSIAVENEINHIWEGLTKNDFGIPQDDLIKVFREIQSINALQAREGAKILNTARTLYNVFDADYSDDVISPDQRAAKQAVLDVFRFGKGVEAAAEEHETKGTTSSTKTTPKASTGTNTPKTDNRKTKQSDKAKSTASKLTSILDELKERLKNLDC